MKYSEPKAPETGVHLTHKLTLVGVLDDEDDVHFEYD